MKKLCILLTALLLGCTTISSPGSELPAVVIKEYNFDQDMIRQGQITGVNLVLQNLGGEKARDIRAEMFRTGEGITVTAPNLQTATLLNPPDDSTQTPGESKEFAWQITANKVANPEATKSYNIGVLVGYEYKSEGWSDLLATTKDQAKIDKNQMPELRSGSTKGPISVNVITPNALLYETGGEKVTVRVDVVNGAKGIVYSSRSPTEAVGGSDEMNKIRSITILIPKKYTKPLGTNVGGIINTNFWCCKPGCTDASEPSEKTEYAWKLDESNTNYPDDRVLTKDYTDPTFQANYGDSLALMRGKQKSYVCYFLINKDEVKEQQVIPVRAIAEYTYSTEDSKILVVEGQK